MSGSTERLRRRIAGANDLKGVVRAMKALAASSLGQYESAVRSLADYARTVEAGLGACLRETQPAEWVKDPFSTKATPVELVVFGSDQGLVGRFNELLADFALTTLASGHGPIRTIWVVGERMHALVAEAGIGEAKRMAAPSAISGLTPLVGQLLVEIDGSREKAGMAEVLVFHHAPRIGAAYEPVMQRLLPLDRLWAGQAAGVAWPGKGRPELIGTAGPTLSALIREHLFVALFRAGAESLASENASRLAAMQRAETNIADILEGLTSTYHRLRQEAIDDELFDVISGYEARL